MNKENVASDAVIDGIYASIVEASSVEDMQRLLAKSLNAAASTMLRVDRGISPMSWTGFDPTTAAHYSSHYHRLDPWIAAGASVPLGVGLNVERLVSRDRYMRSAFYNDFMRHHGGATQLMGVMFAAEDARYSLTFVRVKGQCDFDEVEERRFACWSPHLSRAFRTRDRLERQRSEISTTALFRVDADTIHLLVDADMAVHWMSRADLAEVPDVILRPRPAGPLRLEARSSGAHGALVHAVQEATRRRPALSGAARLGGDFVLVDPYPAAGGGEALALLHIPNRPAVECRAVERATGLFHLTLAEAALCRRLMQGDTVEVHADVMGLSRWTVRTHLRNVFAKTGTSRQAELVAILHRLTS